MATLGHLLNAAIDDPTASWVRRARGARHTAQSVLAHPHRTGAVPQKAKGSPPQC
jgi:hypothetical protein